MAYRELGMWEVLDVLRRVHRGEAKAAIERVTGRTRKTIRRYLKAAAKLGWEPGGREPDEALAAQVTQRLRPGPAVEGSGAAEILAHRACMRGGWRAMLAGFTGGRQLSARLLGGLRSHERSPRHRKSGPTRWEEAKAQGRPAAEHILNLFKAGLAGAPFTGAVASLINDYIPGSRAKRLENFAEQVASDLYAIRDRVGAEFLKTEDFAFMFEKCFRGAAENPQKEKLEAFRGMLVNSATRRDLSEEEKEYFLNLVMNLSALHLRILRFMAFPRDYLASMGIEESRIVGGFRQFFPVAIPGVSQEVIESAFADLYRYRLTNTDHSIFQTMTSGQGLDLLAGRISDFGRRFIAFCISPTSVGAQSAG